MRSSENFDFPFLLFAILNVLSTSYSVIAVQQSLGAAEGSLLFEFVADVRLVLRRIAFSPLQLILLFLTAVARHGRRGRLPESHRPRQPRELPPPTPALERALTSAHETQLLSPQITSDVPAAGLQRYKTLAKDAAKRLPEARIKAVVVEIERGR